MNEHRKIISLDGDWSFAYTSEAPEPEKIRFPDPAEYEVKLPVPAYWDDCRDRMRFAKFWSRDVRFNPVARRIDEFPIGGLKPPDASLPYIMGTGWYKKCFDAELDWSDKCVTLCIGGAMLDLWIWINGEYVGTYYSCGRPVRTDIDKFIRYGSENEILIAVSNLRNDRIGCSIRGYKGKSAGINRSVSLTVTNGARLEDCYVRPNETLDKLIWYVSLKRKTEDALTLHWSIYSPVGNLIVASGSVPVDTDDLYFETESFGIRPWSDKRPELYEIRLSLVAGTGEADSMRQNFGMRYAKREGMQLLINNEPVFLRGTTDHAYFAESCTVPNELSYYMRTIKAVKKAGFNWMRFHTTIPPEECMEAADMLGMYIQTETQNGFEDDDFINMLRLCRRHPSVILYCCGNEVPIDDRIEDQLERMAQKCHMLAPDCLYIPMEALLNVECRLDENEPGYTTEPYEHNEIKLERLRSCSDALAVGVWVFSYHSLYPDIDYINNRMSIYKRPCLIHEAGIFDTYLNLDLEKRYENSRIGNELFSAVRKYVDEMGMLGMAPVYYRNSCRWMKLMMKFALEKARRCPAVSGYDFLGAIDCHWHRSGYAVGVMNEFYELKAGFTLRELNQFNGESIIVSDAEHGRNLYTGERKKVKLFSSLYGGEDIKEGRLTWLLLDDNDNVRGGSSTDITGIKNGRLCELAEAEVGLDEVSGVGEHIRLAVTLTGGIYDISNEWDYWIFNRCRETVSDKYRITNRLTKEDVGYMKNGGRIILTGAEPFPGVPVSFQIAPGGRTGGNDATVIYDHPIMRAFPHDGFCDWQFAAMFRDGGAVQFNELDIEFRPIIEIVSTYKFIRKQAALFELKVGDGGVLVCTLDLKAEDPAAQTLYARMQEYIVSEEFAPKTELAAERLIGMIENKKDIAVDFTTDECYDTGGYIEV